jgi:hypothetical protein
MTFQYQTSQYLGFTWDVGTLSFVQKKSGQCLCSSVGCNIPELIPDVTFINSYTLVGPLKNEFENMRSKKFLFYYNHLESCGGTTLCHIFSLMFQKIPVWAALISVIQLLFAIMLLMVMCDFYSYFIFFIFHSPFASVSLAFTF